MTDNTAGRRGRPPRTDVEWARDIQRRLEALEDSTSVRIGDWVLNVKDGDLIATTIGTTVVLGKATGRAAVARSALESRGQSAGTPSDTAGQ